jgi:hypothetical protein
MPSRPVLRLYQHFLPLNVPHFRSQGTRRNSCAFALLAAFENPVNVRFISVVWTTSPRLNVKLVADFQLQML